MHFGVTKMYRTKRRALHDPSGDRQLLAAFADAADEGLNDQLVDDNTCAAKAASEDS